MSTADFYLRLNEAVSLYITAMHYNPSIFPGRVHEWRSSPTNPGFPQSPRSPIPRKFPPWRPSAIRNFRWLALDIAGGAGIPTGGIARFARAWHRAVGHFPPPIVSSPTMRSSRRSIFTRIIRAMASESGFCARFSTGDMRRRFCCLRPNTQMRRTGPGACIGNSDSSTCYAISISVAIRAPLQC